VKKIHASLLAAAFVSLATVSFAAEVGTTVTGGANAGAGATTPAGSAGASGSANATASANLDTKSPFSGLNVDTKAASEAEIRTFIGGLDQQQATEINDRCTSIVADQQRFAPQDVAYCQTYLQIKKSM
jgi:hypothetical protein